MDRQQREIQDGWGVDTTGQAKLVSRRLGLTNVRCIRRGSTFFWVDGLLNIEKLTDISDYDRLTHKNRRMTGHLPVCLATNHFVGEGYWLWVIPLQGRTSLGIVYDKAKIPEDSISSPAKVIE